MSTLVLEPGILCAGWWREVGTVERFLRPGLPRPVSVPRWCTLIAMMCQRLQGAGEFAVAKVD